jgi:hypothetical protein
MVTISKEYGENKARVENADDAREYTIVDVETSKVTGNTILMITMNTFGRDKTLLPVQRFEEELEITEEQRIKLYNLWGTTKAILVKDMMSILGMGRDSVQHIIALACHYGLLTRGHNSTWKVINSVMQSRWKDEAIVLERTLRRGGEDYKEPMTMLEAYENAKAKGLISKEEETKEEETKIVSTKKQPIKKVVPSTASVEVINENEIYSPAKKAMEAQRKASEEQSKKTREATLGIVDERKSVRQIDTEVYRSTGQKIPIQKASKGLPVKSTPQAIVQKAITPRKIK